MKGKRLISVAAVASILTAGIALAEDKGYNVEVGVTRSFPNFEETNKSIEGISQQTSMQLIPGAKFDDWNGALVANLYVGLTKDIELDNGYGFAVGPFITASKGSIDSSVSGIGPIGPAYASLESGYESFTLGITGDIPVADLGDKTKLLLNATFAIGYLNNTVDYEAGAPLAGLTRNVKGSGDSWSYGASIAAKVEHELTEDFGVAVQAGYSKWAPHETTLDLTDRTNIAGMEIVQNSELKGETDSSGAFASLVLKYSF